MPVITFKYQDLKDLGIDMEKDELKRRKVTCLKILIHNLY